MANLNRLWLSRICAATLVLLTPMMAKAESLPDANELRTRIAAFQVRTAGQEVVPVDVQALRREFGLVPAPAESKTPSKAFPQAKAKTHLQYEAQPKTQQTAKIKPIFGGSGGLFSMQTSQAQTQPGPAMQPTTTPLINPIGSKPAMQQVITPAATAQAGQPLIAPVAAPQMVQSLIKPIGPPRAIQSLIKPIGSAQTMSPTLGAIRSPKIAKKNGVDVSTTNFRLMLATLSQTYGGTNNLSVLMAQGERGATALSVRSGVVSLAEIKSLAAANGMAPREDGTLVAPLVIWPDATLRLRPGERLAMARDTGAFILSMGRLEINGALIESSGPENSYQPNFVPFITVLGGGTIEMVGSTVRGLGFGKSNKFSGLSVAGNPLMPATRKIVLRDNLFDNVSSVALAGTRGAMVTGNRITGLRGGALSLVDAPNSIVEANLFQGEEDVSALRVNNGSDFSTIADNIFLAGKRVAVLINGKSTHVVVRGNLVSDRDGAGIKFLNTRCGLAQGNIVLDNHQKGIEVRKSNGIVVRKNLLVGNNSSGVWVSAQASGAQTTVSDNIFQANGAGLSAATGADIWIEGNNFSEQLPRLLDGDIAVLTNAVIPNLKGSGPLLISKGTAKVQHDLIALCGGET